MFGQISAVLKQALDTFSVKNDAFNKNIEKLTMLMNQVRAEDVNLDPIFFKNRFWDRPNKAPATYINIYQDDNVSIGIFILKPGMVLPLHNHPDMHGLIKVLAGKIRITSYSINTERTKGYETKISSSIPIFSRQFIVVEKSSELISDEKNFCSVLYPEQKNLHQVESIGGPAAFMDILSPPYETLGINGELRRCCYYKILAEMAPNIFKLEKIESPPDFWTDAAPYKGHLSL